MFLLCARTTKMNFVEAHHLVPLQFQKHFSAGLDVLENIVALCPICHRRLHHGQLNDKANILGPLLKARAGALKGRGIVISSENLFSFYSANFDEERNVMKRDVGYLVYRTISGRCELLAAST